MLKISIVVFFFCNFLLCYSNELEFKMSYLDENLVVIDLIPVKQKMITQKKEKRDKFYKVKKGENLISIAKKNQIDWKVLKEINNLKDITDIYPGQTLKISFNNTGGRK